MKLEWMAVGFIIFSAAFWLRGEFKKAPRYTAATHSELVAGKSTAHETAMRIKKRWTAAAVVFAVIAAGLEMSYLMGGPH